MSDRERGSWKLLVLGSVVSLLCGYLTLRFLQAQKYGEGPRRASQLKSPIIGDQVTIAEARARVDYRIPLLPPRSLRDPCGVAPEPLTLVRAWASGKDFDRGMRQVGLTYNMGIWVSVTPQEWMSPPNDTSAELTTLANTFPPDDIPPGQVDGTVRGRQAWIAERDLSSLCSSRTSIDLSGRVVADYDPTVSTNLTWKENGLVIHVVGPFSSDELRSLLSGMTFA